MLRLAARHADIVGILPAPITDPVADDDPRDRRPAALEAKIAVLREAAGDRFGELELNAFATFVVTGRRRDSTEELIARRGWSGPARRRCGRCQRSSSAARPRSALTCGSGRNDSACPALSSGRTGCPRWPRSSAACSAIRPSRSAAPFAAACLQLPGPAMLLRAPGTSSVDRRSIRNDLAFTNSQPAGICAERRIGAVGELAEGPWAMGHICQFLAPCLLPGVRPHVSLSRDGRKV